MMTNPQEGQNTINQQTSIIQQLNVENNKLKDHVKYLENKIKQIINEKIQEKLKDKNIQASSQNLSINHI